MQVGQHVILMGAQGAGKGTQAERITEKKTYYTGNSDYRTQPRAELNQRHLRGPRDSNCVPTDVEVLWTEHALSAQVDRFRIEAATKASVIGAEHIPLFVFSTVGSIRSGGQVTR